MLICPSCRKKYKTGTLTCKRCKIGLLPPSVIDLRDRHPEMAETHGGNISVTQADSYVDLIQCSLNEAKEITQVLEPEGIKCLIEKDDEFHFEYRIEGGSQIADQRSLIIKVKGPDLSKARALLTWETVEEGPVEEIDSRESPGIDLPTCPSCKSRLTATDEDCPECGLPLDQQDPEAPEVRIYRCSVCDAESDPQDLVCSTCGARFDH